MKVIEGICELGLDCILTPDGLSPCTECEQIKKQVLELLDELSHESRTEVFSHYCKFCGDKDPSCQCWNDE